MKWKLAVTSTERTTIVAALMAYGHELLAQRLVAETKDPADDGPETVILSVDGAGWGS